MNRIQPTHFIEVWKSNLDNIVRQSYRQNLYELNVNLFINTMYESKTIAIFLIQPSDLSIEERMNKRLINALNQTK